MPKNLLLLSCLLLIAATCCRAQVDTVIGLSASGKYGTDHVAVAADICFDAQGEKAKANAIYNWVTHNIAYDVKALRKYPKHVDDKVGQTLKNRKAVADGYSMLFTELCRDAGMQAVTVDGYAKDWITDNGDEVYIPRHQWSAVRINGQWQLVDATWGAGYLYQSQSWWRVILQKVFKKSKMHAKSLKFRYRYDPQYFLQDPETFRLKHLPADPLWQLTDTIMSIAVFEAGDSAIRKFNELYSKPKQNDPRLDKIAKLDEKQKLFEYADRAYGYNYRFPVVMALKNTYRAVSIVEKAYTDSTVSNGDIMLKDATNDLRKSLDYIKDQKKAFPEEYNKLKMKNKAKGMEAKQYIRQIKTDDKRLIAESNKRIRSADSKYKRARKKLGDVQRKKNGVSPRKIGNIETSKVKKKEGAPELEAIKDSVDARNTRIAVLQRTAAGQEKDARAVIMASALMLDTLVKALTAEDSMLRMEANAHMNMHDSYDDEVKKWNKLFTRQKYYKTDTLLKYYFAAFDTVATQYERLQKTHAAGFELHKANIRSLEQYRKWNNTDTTIDAEYALTAGNYLEAIDSAATDIADYANYLQGNKKLFGMLNKISKRQIEIVGYMERAEKSRQNLEASSINNKKAFDLKENEKQRKGVQNALEQVQEVVDQIDGVK
jgi:hypothetical protein